MFKNEKNPTQYKCTAWDVRYAVPPCLSCFLLSYAKSPLFQIRCGVLYAEIPVSFTTEPLILTITESPGLGRSRVVFGCFLPNRFQPRTFSCSLAVLSACFPAPIPDKPKGMIQKFCHSTQEIVCKCLTAYGKTRHFTAYSSYQRFTFYFCS